MPRKDLNLNKISDVNNLKIGRIRSGCQDLLSIPNVKVDFIDVNSIEQGLNLVALNRIAAFCADRVSIANQMLNIKNSQNIYGNPIVVSSKEVMVHASKNFDPQKKIALKSACEKLKAKSYFKNTLEKQFGLISPVNH
jgi:hypothetical protein